jgi:hypothetical protein
MLAYKKAMGAFNVVLVGRQGSKRTSEENDALCEHPKHPQFFIDTDS